MSKDIKIRRFSQFDSVTFFESRPSFVIKEVPQGDTGIIFVNMEHSQQVGVNPNTGKIARKPERKVPMFFRPQKPVNIHLDPSGEIYGPFSQRPVRDPEQFIKEHGGDLKSTPKTGGFKFKP